MKIIGIDTSCDDTGISILEVKKPPYAQASEGKRKFNIISNAISSQVKLHAKYGGVYPSLAKREHLKNLPVVLKRALGKLNGQTIIHNGKKRGPKKHDISLKTEELDEMDEILNSLGDNNVEE